MQFFREGCDHLSNNLKLRLKLQPKQGNAVECLLKKMMCLRFFRQDIAKVFIFSNSLVLLHRLKGKSDKLFWLFWSKLLKVWVFRDLAQWKKSLAAQNFTLIVGSAESVMDNRFLHILKDNVSSLHRKLAAVVVDESHTVEMWAGNKHLFLSNPKWVSL